MKRKLWHREELHGSRLMLVGHKKGKDEVLARHSSDENGWRRKRVSPQAGQDRWSPGATAQRGGDGEQELVSKRCGGPELVSDGSLSPNHAKNWFRGRKLEPTTTVSATKLWKSSLRSQDCARERQTNLEQREKVEDVRQLKGVDVDDRYPLGEDGTDHSVYWTIRQKDTNAVVASGDAVGPTASAQHDAVVDDEAELDLIYSEWLIYSQRQNLSTGARAAANFRSQEAKFVNGKAEKCRHSFAACKQRARDAVVTEKCQFREEETLSMSTTTDGDVAANVQKEEGPSKFRNLAGRLEQEDAKSGHFERPVSLVRFGCNGKKGRTSPASVGNSCISNGDLSICDEQATVNAVVVPAENHLDTAADVRKLEYAGSVIVELTERVPAEESPVSQTLPSKAQLRVVDSFSAAKQCQQQDLGNECKRPKGIRAASIISALKVTSAPTIIDLEEHVSAIEFDAEAGAPFERDHTEEGGSHKRSQEAVGEESRSSALENAKRPATKAETTMHEFRRLEPCLDTDALGCAGKVVHWTGKHHRDDENNRTHGRPHLVNEKERKHSPSEVSVQHEKQVARGKTSSSEPQRCDEEDSWNESNPREAQHEGQDTNLLDRNKSLSPDRRSFKTVDGVEGGYSPVRPREEKKRSSSSSLSNSSKDSRFTGPRKGLKQAYTSGSEKYARSSSLPRFDRTDNRNRASEEDFAPHSFRRKRFDDRHAHRREKGGKFYTEGSDIRYRRFGRGTRLGGYSPRRRRSKEGAKTPSPPRRLPESRKPRAWDLPPSSVADGVVSVITQRAGSSQDVACGLQVPQPTALSNVATSFALTTGLGLKQQKIPSATPQALTQASRSMRRLYIGNVPVTVSDGELLEFMNAALLSANINSIPGTKPCINCTVHPEKNYAFAEFITPEDATAALAFDGVMLHGTVLKLRRPKDYVQPVSGGATIAVPSLVSCVVLDSPYKIFLGGISLSLSSEKVKEIVTSFGQLKSYHWEVDSSAIPTRMFAFFEYLDPQVTLKACAGLNGLCLAGSPLIAVQATPNAVSKPEDKPFYGIPESVVGLLETPTRVLVLQNLVGAEEFLCMPEATVCDYLEDIRIECLRFGSIKAMHVTRPPSAISEKQQGENIVETAGGNTIRENGASSTHSADLNLGLRDESETNWGQVYIEYSRAEYALDAASALHGRLFGGRTAVARYFPPNGKLGRLSVPVPLSATNKTGQDAGSMPP